MLFTSQLIHSLSGYHLSDQNQTLTSLLPKSIESAGADSRHLLSPLACSVISMPPSSSLSFLGFHAFCLLYVFTGSGAFQTRHAQHILTESTFLLFSCTEPFTLTGDIDFTYCILYFDGNGAFYFYDTLNAGVPFLLRDAVYLNTEIRALLYACEQKDFFSVHRLMTDIFCESISHQRAVQHTSPVPPELSRVKHFIEESYSQDISLSSLSCQFCINKYRLCREFQAFFGFSPIRYLHLTRIRQAKKLLSATSAKIHEISEQVGYENTNLFIHHFKNIVGLTPGSYRQQKSGDL